MKRRVVIGISFIGILMMMSGCSVKQAIPELSEEQGKQVAQYAVGLLLKYDKNYDSRLLSDEQLEKELLRLEQEAKAKAEREAAEQEKLAQEAQEKQEQEQELADTTVIDNTGESGNAVMNVDEFYGIEDIQIRYSGYQVTSTYPNGESEDMFFSMNATPGKSLLVLDFSATNMASEDKKLDMFSISPKFYITINGGDKVSALSTMLLDDLATYSGTIAAGETVNLVVVTEIDEQTAGNIASILITMRNGSQNATIQTN